MYPHYHAYRCHRHVSRLFWFVFGAGTSAWFLKHREMLHSNEPHARMHYWCSRHQIPQTAYPAPGTERPDTQGPYQDQKKAPLPPPLPMPVQVPDENDRLNELGRSISDFSELTLDALLAKIEAMKASLAESRAHRERQDAEIRALKEAKLQEFLEWKKQHDKTKPDPPRHVV